ncbi:glycosyltransferase family 4 protein [Sphingomonas morindae]|uniref:Glycosyltransferase family 4 protein n=1 Tax=Sphingomonas morindae TaxID=1541170 RepID=A0ABY4X649_9SPHN|nr:glycosyltransferase family 1 protein [Sphingomonas morindae]USI72364.1 glycosyltransferase family 4 protein [Sphingomonas morindae]
MLQIGLSSRMALPQIGLDGYNLAMPHGTGVATYGVTLAATLRSMGANVTGLFGLPVAGDPDLREVLFYDLVQRPPSAQKRRRRWHHGLREALRPLAGFSLAEVPSSGHVEKGAFASRLPQFDRLLSAGGLFEAAHAHFAAFGRFTTLRVANPPEVMHWTYPVPIRLAGARNIYTLHDLVPLRLPYTTLDDKKTYYSLVKRCAKQGDHIVTVSEASAADIVSRFGVPHDRITNTYQASPPPTSIGASAEDAAMVEGIFGLRPGGYFLFFGAIEPKKNIGRLIEAYLTLRSETPLVLVGARAWQSEEELRLLGGAGALSGGYGQRLGDRVVRLEYLPRQLLFRLIRCAKAVAFPSLYEGFGLPVHEAMLLGTPVLSSNVSSIPEVAGDGALLVDPYDTNAIAEGLKRLDEDAALRESLRAAGPRHAQRFSIDHYRARLQSLYERVVSQPSRAA